MIDVMTAVAAADQYLNSFPKLLSPVSRRLEETEIDQLTGDWLITISYAIDPDNDFQALTGGKPRLYRQIRIDKDTGEVISMKQRNLMAA